MKRKGLFNQRGQRKICLLILFGAVLHLVVLNPLLPPFVKGGMGGLLRFARNDTLLPVIARNGVTKQSQGIASLIFAVAEAAEKKDIKKEDIAAEVNNIPITRKEVSDLVGVTLPRITGHRTLPEERMRFFRAQALDQLIEAELFYQEAKREKVKVKKAEIEEELKKIKNRYPDEKSFNEDIKKKGLTVKEMRTGIERYIMIRKIMDAKEEEVTKQAVIKDEDLLSYYEKNRDKFIIPEQIRIRQILISVDPGASEQEWMEAEKRADDISGRAIKGEDFAKLAKEFSDDHDTKEKGGDVGLMHKGQMHLPEIEHVAFSLKESDVSTPIRTIYGWLVIKAEEKKPEKRLEFAELNKDLLKSELLVSAKKKLREEWFKGLRDRADIKIYEK